MTKLPIDTPPPFLTAGGRTVPLFAPTPEDFDISVAAVALARIPRYGGLNAGRKCSVAQHLLLCGRLAARHHHPDYVLPALLHDAAEAYVGDIPRPLKKQLPQLEAIEMGWMNAIGLWANVDLWTFHEDPVLRLIDNLALAVECHVVNKPVLDLWAGLPTPDADDISFFHQILPLNEMDQSASWIAAVSAAMGQRGDAAA